MSRRNRSGKEVRILVAFTARERSLLLEETLADPEHADRFVEKEGRWVAGFTASELDGMLDDLAAAANHASRATLREELDALFDRLEAIVETAGYPCP